VKITKALAAREQKARKRNLTKYIPNAAQAIFTVHMLSIALHTPSHCSALSYVRPHLIYSIMLCKQ